MSQPKDQEKECPIQKYYQTLELVRVETESLLQKNLRRIEELFRSINGLK